MGVEKKFPSLDRVGENPWSRVGVCPFEAPGFTGRRLEFSSWEVLRLTRFAIAILLVSSLFCPVYAQVQPLFFGLHQNRYQRGEPWPTLPFGIRRTVSDFVKWSDIETCPGGPDPGDPCYHWGRNKSSGNLDQVVNDSYQHGVPVMFTFYNTPEWASSRGQRCKGKGVPDAVCVGPADDECGWTGGCDPPTDLDAQPGSGEGDGTDKAFKDFVTAMVKRYGNKIKYWEVWNEAPNIISANPQYWTYKQWARMTKDMHDIVKAAIPDAVILSANTCGCTPKGSADPREWTDGYFAALEKYGPSVVDVLSYHGYVGNAKYPERVYEIINELNRIKNNHSSTRGKPIWDTENSWGGGGQLENFDGSPDWSKRNSFLARSLILTASKGVMGYIYYGWDLRNSGELWDADKKTGCTTPNKDGKPGFLCPTAVVWTQTRDWLLGASFDQACDSDKKMLGTIWTCDFSKNNGKIQGRFAWYVSLVGEGTTSYSPGGNLATVRALDGKTISLTKSNASFDLGDQPVMIETSAGK